MNRTKWTAVIAVGTIVVATWGVSAQQSTTTLPNARPVWENATGGAIATRLPGNMVQAGTNRFQTAHDAAINHARNGPTITATSQPSDAVDQLKVDLLNVIITDFNTIYLPLIEAYILGQATPSGGGGSTPTPNQPGTDASDLLGTVTSPGA
jgi:hypothetical protein